jgi:hypothetical protein
LESTNIIGLDGDVHVDEYLFARERTDDLKPGIGVEFHRPEVAATEHHHQPVWILSNERCRESGVEILDVVEPHLSVSILVDVLLENLLDLSSGRFDDGEAVLIIDSLSAHRRRASPIEPPKRVAPRRVIALKV